MDPKLLSEWTAFALKGGLCQGFAKEDFVAQGENSLMFLKGDIVVALEACEKEGVYWGYCEGVLGQFKTTLVDFPQGAIPLPPLPTRQRPRPSELPDFVFSPDPSPAIDTASSPVTAVPLLGSPGVEESLSSFEFDSVSCSRSTSSHSFARTEASLGARTGNQSPQLPLTPPSQGNHLFISHQILQQQKLKAPSLGVEFMVTSPTATNFSMEDDLERSSRRSSGQSWASVTTASERSSQDQDGEEQEQEWNKGERLLQECIEKEVDRLSIQQMSSLGSLGSMASLGSLGSLTDSLIKEMAASAALPPGYNPKAKHWNLEQDDDKLEVLGEPLDSSIRSTATVMPESQSDRNPTVNRSIINFSNSDHSLHPAINSLNRNRLGSIASSVSASSDVRFESELSDLFDAYGRESMYACPDENVMEAQIRVQSCKQTFEDHEDTERRDGDEEITIEGRDEKSIQSSESASSLVKALSELTSLASPLDDSSMLSVLKGLDQGAPLSEFPTHIKKRLSSENLASSLRNRIMERNRTADLGGQKNDVEAGSTPGLEIQLDKEDVRDMGRSTKRPPPLKLDVSNVYNADTAQISSPATPTLHRARTPTLEASTSASTSPSVSSPTDSQSKSILRGQTNVNLYSSPGPVPISFFLNNSQTHFTSPAESPIMSPKSFASPKINPSSEGFAGVGAGRPAVVGDTRTRVMPRRERPRSKSFSSQQGVEIGFPMLSTSEQGAPQCSFVTLNPSPVPRIQPGDDQCAPYHVSRPTLQSLGSIDPEPVRSPTVQPQGIQRKTSEHSLLAAIRRAENLPVPSIPSTFRKPTTPSSPHSSSPFLSRPETPRSVSDTRAGTMTSPSINPISPTSPKIPKSRGFMGFGFLRSKSQSNLSISSPGARIDPFILPPQPSPSFSSGSPPVLKSILIKTPVKSEIDPLSSPVRSTDLGTDSSLVHTPAPSFGYSSSPSRPRLATTMSSGTLPSFVSSSNALDDDGEDLLDFQPRRMKPRTSSSSSTSSFRDLVKSKIHPSPKTDSKMNPMHSPVSHTDFKESTVKEGKFEFELMNPLAQKLASKSSVNLTPNAPSSTLIPQTDEWGFFIPSSMVQTFACQRRTASLGPEAVQASEQKWLSIMDTTPSNVAALQKNKKIKKLLRSDLPSSLRTKIWAFLCDAGAKRESGLFAKLVEKGEASDAMVKDCSTVYTDHSLFNPPNSGQKDLLNILKAYGQYNSRLDYKSGMPEIAGCFAILCPAEDAFWLFATTIDRIKGYHNKSLPIDAMCFVHLLEAVDKPLAKRLIIDCQINPEALLRAWILPMFVRVLPWRTVLRVLDIFFLEDLTFLLRISLAILITARDRLLDSATLRTPAHVKYYLYNLPSDELVSPEKLISVADGIKQGMKDDEMMKLRTKAVDELAQGRRTAAKAKAQAEAKALRKRV
ncbi:PDZ-domain interacting protein EPI64, contains TBC domain [Phaffia rhodozyma]|uniref:PDZ-domain interacting protein EPI64, contains TBC domain n=1 Tax=Phaffia rhodozyma TaxID=264483 RepID=A0A0F7SPZ6_PHARH|nr:PDZ-domain interacting protein EPI64, contains TBC domain [Phaffia rhodozyma]